jgi:hypothetical protein
MFMVWELTVADEQQPRHGTDTVNRVQGSLGKNTSAIMQRALPPPRVSMVLMSEWMMEQNVPMRPN